MSAGQDNSRDWYLLHTKDREEIDERALSEFFDAQRCYYKEINEHAYTEIMNSQRHFYHGAHLKVRTSKGYALLSRSILPRNKIAKLKAVLDANARIANRLGGSARRAEPPKLAEFCLSLLLSKTSGEAAIGDLSERFENDRRRFGAARARRIYWGRTLKSFWPLLRRAAARVIKWGFVVESVRRLF